MHRFYLPPEECGAQPSCLTGREAHHALHVLRVRPGEQVTVLNGAGGRYLCQVREADRNRIGLALLAAESVPPPPCRITLLQAIPKARLFDSIVQKATELGVFRVVPVLATRTVAHLEGEAAAHKAAKWQAVAVEAIKQCGSAWLPRVEPPVTVEEFLARQEPAELSLLASLGSGSRHPRDYFRGFQAAHGRKPATAAVWVGPEGDFSPEEIALIQAAGVKPITLGPLVLRTETAAVYCLSILSYELHGPEA